MELGLQFSPAELSQAVAITDLVNSVYRGEGSKLGWTTEADLLDGSRVDLEMIEAMIQSSSQVILVAILEFQLVACVALDRKRDSSYLGMLSVDVSQQCMGVSRRLLEVAEGYAKQEWGSLIMEMKVIGQRKELIAYYQRRGYILTGITLPFPPIDPRIGIPKRDDLYFEVLTKELF